MLESNRTERSHHRSRTGKLLVVGIGPGSLEDRTIRAIKAIQSADIVIGYRKYLDLIMDLIDHQEIRSSGMTLEVQRVQWAIEACREGKTVALISSGDPGVYGMAGLALELLENETQPPVLEVIPGITAANSAAARLGAPLMLDYCCISLSDLMVPWDMIRKRIHAAGQGDFVVALYNPKSKKRISQFEETIQILLQYRPANSPVGIVHSIGLTEESSEFTTLGELWSKEIHMRSTVIIGNSTTKRGNNGLLTPRGYL